MGRDVEWGGYRVGSWRRGNEKKIKGEKGMKMKQDHIHQCWLFMHSWIQYLNRFQLRRYYIHCTLAIVQQVLLTMPYIGALCRQYVFKNLQCTLPSSYLC